MEKEFTYFWDRFEEIFSNGWIANEYTELYTEDLVLLSDFLTKNYPRDLSLPKIFAVGDDVILEWNINNNDSSLDIKIWNLQGLWHNLNHDTGEEEEFTIDLVDDDNWIEIFDKIRDITVPPPCPPFAAEIIKDFNEAVENGEIIP